MARTNDTQLVERLAPKVLSYIRAKAQAVEMLPIKASLDGITSMPCYDTTGGLHKCVLVPITAIASNVHDSVKEELEPILDRTVFFQNVPANNWVTDGTFNDYPYRCDVHCEGVTGDDYANVVFAREESESGLYAMVCETVKDAVRIWSATDKEIVIPTIIVNRNAVQEV